MKHTKRLLALLLAMLMLIAMVSCGDDKPGNTETGDGNGTEAPKESVDANIPESAVPKNLKFTGQEARILIHGTGDKDFTSTIENDTIIGKALFDRNDLTESRLDLTLNYVSQTGNLQTEYLDHIRNAALIGGDDNYDIITSSAYYTAALAAEGLFYNLNTGDEVNYVTPDQPWYHQSFVKGTAYKNKLFFITGDLTLTATDRAPVTFFNEDELAKWSIEDNLYSKALAGEWTMEYMQTLIKDIHVELDNADGQTKGDYYGLFFNSGSMCVDAMLVAAGINITNTKDDGTVEITWSSGTSVDAFEKIYEMMYETSGVYLGTVSKEGGTYYGSNGFGYYSEQSFYEKRAVFSFGILYSAQQFAADASLHYGMLPLPKYDKNQDYATTPQDGYAIVAIPQNVGDRLQLASATLETLSESSYIKVRPTYYELAYKVRYASSEDTAKLFDTIIESVKFSFGSFYSSSLGNPAHTLRNRLVGSSTEPNSNLLGVAGNIHTMALQMQLDKLLAEFDGMGNG